MLLVEDNDMQLETLETLLAQSGYRVLSVTSAVEAMLAVLCDGGKIDVVLTEARLSRSDGLQLADTVRSIYPEMKFVYLAACRAEHPLNREIALRGEPLLEAPVERTKLLRVLRDTLNRSS